MSDQDECNRLTSEEILRGVPLSQRLRNFEDEKHSQLQPPHINLCSTALTDRLYNEELFLVRLLSYQRDDHRRIREALVGRVDRLLQTIPVELLSYQWLQKCTLSAEVRAFLVQNLIPVVVLGLEHILREADHRGLCKTIESENAEEEEILVRMDVNFNPINRLAEFLMRNNPRYINITGNICLTSYTRSIQQVLELLKQDLFLQSDTTLAKYTATSERKKSYFEDIKNQAKQDLDEKQRRLEPIFDCFRLEGKDTINATIVQKSMQAFLRIVMEMPHDMFLMERPIVHVEYVDKEVEDYSRSEFMTYAMACVRPLSMEIFQACTNHMQRCGREYREFVNLDLKLDHVVEVTVSCDKDTDDAIGKTDLYEKFEQFAKESNAEIRQYLVFPHEWRIHEYHLRHSKFDRWDKSVEILPYRSAVRLKNIKPRVPESFPIRQNEDVD